jgi:hypothetical protein
LLEEVEALTVEEVLELVDIVHLGIMKHLEQVALLKLL